MSHSVNDELDSGPDSPYAVRAVLRVLDIFDLLKRSYEGVSLAEIVEVTGLPKSSAFRYLSTLEARHYIDRAPEDGSYRLGLAFFPVEGRHLEAFAGRVRPHAEALRDRLNETINVGVLRGNLVTYVEVAESRQPIRFSTERGARNLLHSTALGKAIAAYLPEKEVRRILAATGMPKKTPRTITDADEFVHHLNEVRRRGYAVDNLEDGPDCRCVAVPLRGAPFPSSLSLSAPSSRLSLRQIADVAGWLSDAARQIDDDFVSTGVEQPASAGAGAGVGVA